MTHSDPRTHSDPPAPTELASGVYLLPDHRRPLVPNTGIIVGERAALVVDAGLGPRAGRAVHEIARRLAGDRPLYLTLTHFHPEHGFGAQAFTDATLLYNRAQRDELRQKGPGYLAQFRGMGPEIAGQLEGVEFVEPHLVYDGGADLDLGGMVVHLRATGAAHSRGDQTVWLPAERVLFTGDLVETRFHPVIPYFPPYDVDADVAHWTSVLEALIRLEPLTVVPGHGEVGDAGLLATEHDYLSLYAAETRRLAAEGQGAEAITAALMALFGTRYPDWDNLEPWRIAAGVQAILAAGR